MRFKVYILQMLHAEWPQENLQKGSVSLSCKIKDLYVLVLNNTFLCHLPTSMIMYFGTSLLIEDRKLKSWKE